jgi:hypothetical protein
MTLPENEMIELANLVVSAITAIAATYLALAALKHGAKPRLLVLCRHGCSEPMRTSSDRHFIFDVINLGHWYAKPPAHDIIVEFWCSSVFARIGLLNVSRREIEEAVDTAPSSPGRQMTVKSLPITLYAGERTKFALQVQWYPFTVGRGVVHIRAYSANGAWESEQELGAGGGCDCH